MSVSRGFRAPHMTDLGTLGLTGSGFEVAAPDVAGLGGFVGTTADAAAVSTGDAVAQVGPRRACSTKARHRLPPSASGAPSSSLFVNNVHDNIQKQALILPPGAVGTTPRRHADHLAERQRRRVRGRDDRAGAGARELRQRAHLGHRAQRARRASRTPSPLHDGLHLPARARTRDRAAAEHRRRHARARRLVRRALDAAGRTRGGSSRTLHVGWKQTHLSSLDLGDRRTGSGRTRTSIRAFFLNGARASGWIGPGADNVFGTADDMLTATGETLAQIQDRVLGVGVNSSSLFPTIPGYATFGVRAAFRAGRHE